jgi:hypothetical protein
MKQIIVMHPYLAIACAAMPLLFAVVCVWRGKSLVRIVAALSGMAWAVVAAAYLTYIVAETGAFLDRKNFIFLPVEAILHSIGTSVDAGQMEVARSQLEVFQRNWNVICMTTNDPWIIQQQIEAIGSKEGTNNTSDGIRQPADGLPKPSM